MFINALLDPLFLRPNKVKYLVMEYRQRLRKRVFTNENMLLKVGNYAVQRLHGEAPLVRENLTTSHISVERTKHVEDEDLPELEAVCEMACRAMLLGRRFFLRRLWYGLRTKEIFASSFATDDSFANGRVTVARKESSAAEASIVLTTPGNENLCMAVTPSHNSSGQVTAYCLRVDLYGPKPVGFFKIQFGRQLLKDTCFKMSRDHGVKGMFDVLLRGEPCMCLYFLV